VNLLLEELQDHLAGPVGDRERQHAELLLRLQRLEADRSLVHVGIDKGADDRAQVVLFAPRIAEALVTFAIAVSTAVRLLARLPAASAVEAPVFIEATVSKRPFFVPVARVSNRIVSAVLRPLHRLSS
jgi:hypothetical protein